jgi:hypothetical protein
LGQAEAFGIESDLPSAGEGLCVGCMSDGGEG